MIKEDFYLQKAANPYKITVKSANFDGKNAKTDGPIEFENRIGYSRKNKRI